MFSSTGTTTEAERDRESPLTTARDDRLRWMDGVASRDLVRQGEATALELTTAAVERIDSLNPSLNAVSVPLYEFGLAAAADPALAHGPFTGVPFLLKDAGACYAGLPQFLGSGLLRSLGWTAPADTVLGSRFRDCGFITVGKTNLPEFGVQATTEPLAFGPTRNPWDPARSVGGSSGGAAAAVAAGLVPIAHASDIGGSIRMPAAWCGVVGLKPSRGRTSTAPIIDPNLVEHVITRSVRDTAEVLASVAGPTRGDPYTLAQSEIGYLEALETYPAQLRIGLLTTVDASSVSIAADCVKAAEDAGRLLETLGHAIEPAGPRRLFDDAFVEHTFISSAREFKRMLDNLAQALGRALTPTDIEPFSWALAEAGANINDEAYSASQTWERGYTADVTSWWNNDYDLLLTPAVGEPPTLLGELVPTATDPLAILGRYRQIWGFAAPFSVTGQPAISLPIGRSNGGLPIGIQLVASLGREDLLIQVAAQLERAAPFTQQR